MANFLTGEATFTYDERQFRLTLNNRIWFEVEDVLGESMLDVAESIKAALDAGKSPLLKHVVAITYGGLRVNHPDVTQEYVIDMFFSGDTGFRNALLQALQGTQSPPARRSVTPGEQVARGKPRKAAVGTGRKSTARGAARG